MNLFLESKIIYYRKFVPLFFDLLFCFFSTWLSLSLLNSNLHIIKFQDSHIYILPIILYLLIFLFFGTHRNLVRYTNIESIIKLTKVFLIYAILILILFFLFDNSLKKIFLINQIILFYLLSLLTRIYFSTYFNFKKTYNKTNKILVYGAGSAGINLFQNILKKSKYNLIAFVDDDLTKQKRLISGIPIISYNDIENYKKKYFIEEIILAIPSLKFDNRRKIIQKLSKLNVKIKTLPDLISFINNKNFVINDLSLNDLIERNLKSSINNSIFYQNKTILVSGGGGSIGSELSRQLCSLKPRRVIIFDHSEYNLYKVSSELNNLMEITKVSIEVISILGTVKDYDKLQQVFINYKPEIVLHAAAYKHVNLLEKNIIEGVINNILGTSNILQLSKKYKVENFLLVSTDKAVRPTNFMGATKRVAEMILLSEAESLKPNFKFSIVRFGNVLGSSGSVIPLFNKQINNKEAVTVTHPDVERYIMTVPEAVKLILESVQISKGGEIFLLDMGKPVKILDLAKKLINLSGLTVKTPKNVNGDIEIKFIGLRPGEKLSEELLIDSKSYRTSNANIYIANEKYLKKTQVDKIVNLLKEFTLNYDDGLIIDLLKKNVEGFEKYYK